MDVLMVQCDNPKCDSVGHPECVVRNRVKNGPYGWHQGKGGLVGCGPNYTYMACSRECVGPAIIAQLKAAYEENER